jgi:hypothetical protein
MKVLSEKDKQAIRDAWNKAPADTRTKADFARTYDVSPRTIGRIIDGDERTTNKTAVSKPAAKKVAKKTN